MLTAGEAVTFGLLSAAVLALWLPGRRQARCEERLLRAEAWPYLLAAAAVGALGFGYLDLRGLAVLLLLAMASWAFYRRRPPPAARPLLGLGLFLLAAALTAHRLPGFANPVVISGEVLTPGATPYTRYLNFDKTAAGLLLLAFAGPRIRAWRDWRRTVGGIGPVVAVLFAVILPLALALGHVRFEPALRPHLLLWAWTNLLFTCMAEEALFRGLVQGSLERRLAGRRWGGGVALAAAAVLFGLAHLAGGWTYVLLSTVAGLGYGWALRRTGRIEGAILTHFAVNAAHFGFFTYPALAVQ